MGSKDPVNELNELKREHCWECPDDRKAPFLLALYAEVKVEFWGCQGHGPPWGWPCGKKGPESLMTTLGFDGITELVSQIWNHFFLGYQTCLLAKHCQSAFPSLVHCITSINVLRFCQKSALLTEVCYTWLPPKKVLLSNLLHQLVSFFMCISFHSSQKC